MILLLLTSVRNCCTFAKRYPQKRYVLFSSYGNYKSKHREAAGFATGPDESVYAGKTYKLSITFPADYPYSPPTIVFASPIFHPNVDQNGAICLDILQDKWSAIYNVRTTLLSIRSVGGLSLS